MSLDFFIKCMSASLQKNFGSTNNIRDVFQPLCLPCRVFIVPKQNEEWVVSQAAFTRSVISKALKGSIINIKKFSCNLYAYKFYHSRTFMFYTYFAQDKIRGEETYVVTEFAPSPRTWQQYTLFNNSLKVRLHSCFPVPYIILQRYKSSRDCSII